MIRKMDLVIALYIFGVMVAELMGAKTFNIVNIGGYQLRASVAIFVMPLLFSLTDIVVEVFGRKRARSMVYSGISMVVLLILFAAFATALPASARFAPTESAYDTIFHASIRLSIASIAAFAVSELLDVFIFSKMRERLGKKALWFRNNASNFISQFVDSAVFMTLAFYAIGTSLGANFSFIVGLLIPYWLLRCALSVFGTPFVYAGVRWLKKDKTVAA